MSRRVVIATGNAGKLAELARLLAPGGLECVSQVELGVEEAEENGLSFVENAIIKARNAARHTGLAAIADDSGLEVDALNGRPGIRSARFAGPGASDRENVERLLAEIEGVDDQARGARFVCVAVYMRHAEDPVPVVCTGSWRGAIARAPRGSGGFGYDPVFLVPGTGLTAAELSPGRKDEISHRAKALACLREHLAGG